MSLERLLVLALIFVLIFALIGWAVPASAQRIAYIVVGTVAIIVLLAILFGRFTIVHAH